MTPSGKGLMLNIKPGWELLPNPTTTITIRTTINTAATATTDDTTVISFVYTSVITIYHIILRHFYHDYFLTNSHYN